jgi:hypothetical protein
MCQKKFGMSMKTDKFGEFVTNVSEILKDCYKFCYFTREKEFQKEAVEKLKELKIKIIAQKEYSIDLKDESNAKVFLGMEYLTEAVINELKMWIALKENNPNDAWDFLINAQDSAKTACNCCSIYLNLNSDKEDYIKKLYSIEKVIFPPQIFGSPGLIIEEMKCSICNQDLEDCEHIPGKVYMGKICHIIAKKIKGQEFSILFEKEPDNKKARLHTYEKNGVSRDVMTWKKLN